LNRVKSSRIGEIVDCRAEIQEAEIDDDIANVFHDRSVTETDWAGARRRI
jgi:hypothetical protein